MKLADCTEQERHGAFETMVGSPTRAFQLLNMWKRTYDHRTAYDRLGSKVSQQEVKERKLRVNAKRAGFTTRQINAFFAL